MKKTADLVADVMRQAEEHEAERRRMRRWLAIAHALFRVALWIDR